MKSGCGLHLGLLFLAFVVSFSLVYSEARRPQEAARGDRMDDMRVAVVSGDTAGVVPYGELRELGDHHVFQSMIKQTVRLGEAPLVGRPVTTYATNSEAARAYRGLAREVIELG